jgi:hypothetical protein
MISHVGNPGGNLVGAIESFIIRENAKSTKHANALSSHNDGPDHSM